jgi:MraZ protein
MFMGEYHPNLDDKGRVAIPVKLRKAFGGNTAIDKLVITHGFDRCIMAFREEDWKEFIEKKIVPLSQSDPRNRTIMRRLFGGAYECDLDGQGRILIPSYLLEDAGIKKDITILGLYKRIEIWSSEEYKNYRPGDDAISMFGSDLGF